MIIITTKDIDLFDEGSLFQHICRSETVNGEQILANWLNSNNIQDIEDKQITVKELANKADWRQNYQITASLIDKEQQSHGMLNWIKTYQTFVPSLFRILPYIFSVLSIGLIISYFNDILPGKYLMFWFLLGLSNHR